MKIEGVELREITIPLRTRFETSFGTQTQRDVLLVKVLTGEAEGWGECVSMAVPLYSSEFTAGAVHVLREWLVPRLLAERDVSATRVATLLEPFKGHRMAKAALEMAVLDAELRPACLSLADYLGATRTSIVPGVSVGIEADLSTLLDIVDGFVNQGYRRVKLKIKPGWDLEPVRAVREAHPDLLLQVDANAAYSLSDARTLARLDEFDLLLVEQPLSEDDLTEHARLATRLRTPICLDESIVSAKSAADAISLGACSVVNIKPGRVGGLLEARKIHDVCRAQGIPVWCGGMLETGLGRAANLALAGLPGFTLPGDVSASDRYYEQDITAPFTLRDGQIEVPNGPGIGVEVKLDMIEEFSTHTVWISGATAGRSRERTHAC